MIYPQESTVIFWITAMDSCNPHCDVWESGCIWNYTFSSAVVIIPIGIVFDENDTTKINGALDREMATIGAYLIFKTTQLPLRVYTSTCTVPNISFGSKRFALMMS